MSQHYCPLHPHVVLRCPACTGAKGGAVSSPRKTAAVRKNASVSSEAKRKAAQEREAAKRRKRRPRKEKP